VTRIIDISPRISPALAVWPGDTPPSRHVLLDMARGDNLTLSTLRTTVHAGAHADAPSHYDADGRTIEQCALDRYIGPCHVVHAPTPRGARLSVEAYRAARAQPMVHPRVLIATGSFPDAHDWNEDFAGLAPELVDELAARGVRLVGIDTPSIDLQTSRELPAHARCAAHDVLILEGLVLAHVPAGDYELIALPLSLAGFDASPVRAVLRAT
jgi:arylformamidase